MADSYDVYLVLHPFRGNLARLRALIRPLARIDGIYLSSVEIFYRLATDTALAVLSFSHHALAHLGEDSIHLLALRSRLPIIVPARLPMEERRRFFLEHLSDYEVYLPPAPAGGDRPPVEEAIERLAEQLTSMAGPLPIPLYDVTDELPLFHPWWRRDPSPDLELR